jgi:FKBP-type peptidyl-prolyl cis-trans isomerase 2
MPMHYVTVEFRLQDEDGDSRAIETSGQHRFLYGVESWIEGVDQHLENLREGEDLKLVLESDGAEFAASRLLGPDRLSDTKKRLTFEVRIVKVVKAKPREVVKALAASVKCCDHCGSH